MSGIVKAIKKYHQCEVANAASAIGYRWKNPARRPTNIEKMLTGMPRPDLLAILNTLKAKP